MRNADKIEQIWTNHFQKLLNTQKEIVNPTQEDIKRYSHEITTPYHKEMMSAIQKMKNSKGLGDIVHIEFIKTERNKLCGKTSIFFAQLVAIFFSVPIFFFILTISIIQF